MTGTIRASRLAVARPRPQLLRERWAELDGTWGFAHDDAEVGERDGWQAPGHRLGGTITVPYPPESPASGVGDDRYHDVVWYHRDVPWDDVLEAGFHTDRPRLHLHFGAVDYRASVWVNGVFAGSHEGGHTPFGFDITGALVEGGVQHIAVRAEDRAADVEQPRGKQDWQEDAHVIWYRRTTGIWQPVWLEATPELFVEQLHLTPDVAGAVVEFEVNLNRPPAPGTRCRIELVHGDETIAELTTTIGTQRHTGTITVPRLRNGQDRERILWSPDSPTLLDATVTVETPGGAHDTAYSYLGLRTVAVRDGQFLLNDVPVVLRSVLSQGYWPQTHLAAPNEVALRAEVELIQSLGFNSARVHQKIEDPRFLYWADRLGLLLWAETPAAYLFSATAVERLTREWIRAIDRDRSHPSVVTWVPLNESWGIQDVSHSAAQRAFASGLVQLTRSLDPTRPVISNDGWEHLESDILSVHDYDHDSAAIRARYLDADARDALHHGVGPAGRAMVLTEALPEDAPLMLTEFGGIEFIADGSMAPDGSWGYSTAGSAEQFEDRLRSLYRAVHDSTVLAGTCYTQLTDTMQEANGLCTEDRTPKLAAQVIRDIVTGDSERP
ncbi:MAG TPA: glycoside hydrolase family 2 TIM barrel-domain containing protein [Microbacteriaceae bacterium]|jgi:beta-galactosidase/beta-glucuronidase|nr:glycoside hydrolase family 2 TIM barrel-domain containing protein [Microbacteriaceae bacterium]